MSEAELHAVRSSSDNTFLAQIQEAIPPAVTVLSSGDAVCPPRPVHNPYPGGHPVAEVWVKILAWAMSTGTREFSLVSGDTGMTLEYDKLGHRVRLMEFPLSLLSALVDRFKSSACLDMAVRDIIQHGTMPLHYRVDDRVYILHLQTIPTQWGERLEICIQPPGDIDPAVQDISE